MRSIICFAVLLPLLGKSQTIITATRSQIQEDHIRSITAFDSTSKGENISAWVMYDTSARLISSYRLISWDTNHSVFHDSLVWRGKNKMVLLQLGGVLTDDSSVTTTITEGRKVTSTTFSYREGKMREQQTWVRDSLYAVFTTEVTGSFNYMMVSHTQYVYDSLGRLTNQSYVDSTYYGEHQFEDERTAYTISYGPTSCTRMDYEVQKGKKKLVRVSFGDPQGCCYDSIVNYNRKGKIESIEVIRRDSASRRTSYIETTRKGKILYQENWLYSKNRITAQVFDEKGILTSTRQMIYNDKDLLIQEIITSGNQSRKVTTYVYTYY